MLFYFVVFIVIGFVIGAMQKNVKIASVIIIAISLCWAVVFGPWALAALVELIIGYALAKYLAKDEERTEVTQSLEQVDKRSDVLIRDEVTGERQKSNGFNAILDKVGSLSVDELKRELQNESQRSCLNEIKALLEMPESLRTPRHFQALTFACANNLGEPICEVPDELKAGFYHALANESGLSLQYVPDALKTTELCLEAVQDTSIVLEDVPENIDKVSMNRALEARKVKYLVHFTQQSNIDSILQYGLVPKSMVYTLPTPVTCNDELRLDSREGANCLSIQFPNHRMFYKYRKVTEGQGVDWAVIVFSKEILVDKDCLFCPVNAASSLVRIQSENSLKGVKAFNALYADDMEEPIREKIGLPDSWPTDPQAEVLVKGIIEPRYIIAITFNKSTLAEKFKLKYPHMDIRTNHFFYNARDYALGEMRKWQ